MKPRLGAVSIVVSDMKKSIAFYRDLGVSFPSDLKEEGEDHVHVVLDNGVMLAWDLDSLIKTLDQTWKEPSGGARITIAFSFESPSIVDKVYSEMISKGHKGHLEPWDAFWGHRYAVLKDADGNSVDLFSPL